MFLLELKIIHKGKIARTIRFKRGLNLILDTTPSENKKQTGNSVGKSTILRIVDYCFGGKIENIYTEPEFNNENTEAKYFMEHPTTQIDLLTTINNERVLISRKHNSPPKINNVEYQDGSNKSLFRDKLRMMIWGLDSTAPSKPTLRQLMPKFIRVEPSSLENTIKYLKNGKGIDYDRIYAFLFRAPDIKLMDSRLIAKKKLDETKNSLRVIKKLNTASMRQKISHYDRTIRSLEQNIDDFNLTEGVNREMNAIAEVRAQVSDVSLNLSKIDVKIKLQERTVNSLQNLASQIDKEMLQDIYNQAEIYNQKLHRSFSELEDFHNAMINNKIDFSTQTIERLLQEKRQLTNIMDNLLEQERLLLRGLSNKDALEDFSKLQRALSQEKESRAELQAIIKKEKELSSQKALETEELSIIEEGIRKGKEELENNVNEFNKLFSLYSSMLYGDGFIFSIGFNEEGSSRSYLLDPQIDSTQGLGLKRAEIAVFDLAYLVYSTNTMQTVHFIMHDRIEAIHAHQISTLFELASKIDGQYIVAALKDKITNTGYTQEDIIVELSQNDKLLRVEQFNEPQ